MGKSHKAIGIATGVTTASIGIYFGDPWYFMAIPLCGAAAMLPDIDHDNSKIGRQRKEFFEKISSLSFGILGFILGMIVTDGFYKESLISTLLSLALLAGMSMGIVFIKKAAVDNKYINFFVKHRGIMHTMIVPAILLSSSFMLELHFLAVAFRCVAIGYTSHLLSDAVTVSGCPLMYPFSMKNVGLKLIKTNTSQEKLACVVMIVSIIILGVIPWLI